MFVYKNLYLKICLYLISPLFLLSCNKADYIPDIDGVEWKNLASPVPDVFTFRSDDETAYKSKFYGQEVVNYSNVYKYSGDFENHKIHFTFSTGPYAGTTYSGTIDGSGVSGIITLNTPNGQITLTR